MNRRISAILLSLAVLTANGCAAFVGYSPSPAEHALPHALTAREAPTDVSISLSSDVVGDGASPSTAMTATQTISLAEVIARAREDSNAVLEATANLDAASGRAQTATGDLLPGAALEAGGSYLNGRQVGSFGEVRDGVAFGRFQPSVSLFYRVNPGASVNRSSRFHHEADAAAFAARDVERTAALQAALGYFDVTLAQASVRIATDLVSDSDRFVRITQARAQAEIGSGADVARADADAAHAKQTLIRARAQWERASVRLAVLLRWPPNRLLVPSERELRPRYLVDATAESELALEATRVRPDLNAARARTLAADSQASSAWWDLLGPEIDAGVRERFVGTAIDNLGRTTLAQVFVSFSFDFGELGRLRTARAEARNAAIREQSLRDQVGGELATALSNVRATQAMLPEARRATEATERSYQTELSRFQAGTGLGIEVIEAQNARARARQSLAEAILRYNAAQMELAATVGHLAPELMGPASRDRRPRGR